MGCNVADTKVETLAEWSALRSAVAGAERMVSLWAAQLGTVLVEMMGAIEGQQWDDGRVVRTVEYEVGN